MFKTLNNGVKVFQLYFEANGVWAFFDLIFRFYEGTFYPLIQVYLLARLLDILASGQQLSFASIASIAEIFIAASIFRVVFGYLVLIRGPGYEFALSDLIELKIDKKLNDLDPAVFENAKFQSLLAQMDGVKGAMGAYIVRLMSVLDAAVQLVTSIVVVATGFPVFIPIILLSTIPSFIFLNKYRDEAWPFWATERGVIEKLFQYIRTTLSNPSTSKEVAIFKNGPLFIEKFKQSHDSYYKRYSKVYKKYFFVLSFSGIIETAAFILTQAINLAAVFAGKLLIGQFTLYFQQTLVMSKSSSGLLDAYSSMSMRSKYIDQYFKLLNYRHSIVLPKEAENLPKKPSPPTIEFKNVFFKYPDTNKFILKNFNLKIESHEKIALVGENGAGKSTLIKLILRFYDVTEGEILINGINIKNIDLAEWHKDVGALFQDFIKYQFTFKENVIYGDLNKKDDLSALKEAIRKSGANGFLEDLPKGIDQVVGKTFENGVDLSGGQWQKLALARAFFRDAPVLVLDEPTSAIDAKAEYEIFENVQKLQKDKTVIIISHRFSTVRNADRILVLDEGRIVEEGNHKNLMDKKGLYAELFNIQAQGYK